MEQEHVLIIGNGISGITAARHIRKKSNKKISVISSESDHFFSRTALMYIFMGHMKYEHTKPYEDWFWEKNRIDLVRGRVKGLDEQNTRVVLEDGRQFEYDKLIIATGSRSRMLKCPGLDLKGVQGLYSLQDLEKMEESVKGISHAVIAGGGLIGVEMAEMLHSRGIEVTMLIRELGYWRNILPPEESDMISRHLQTSGIKIKFETYIKEIHGDSAGRVKSIETNSGERIDCQFTGITIGVEPNIGFLKDSNIETNRGILVDPYLRTNLTNVYAVGDCTEQRSPLTGRRPIEAVWYTGRMMGEVVAENVCGTPVEYKPGIWFNSAKFFDIEYQTYGNVPAEIDDSKFTSFVWKPDSGNKLLHLLYDTQSGQIRGINALGIRLRHEVCDNWISNGYTITSILEKFEEAQFDPELYRSHKKDILLTYNMKNPGKEVDFTSGKGVFNSLFSY